MITDNCSERENVVLGNDRYYCMLKAREAKPSRLTVENEKVHALKREETLEGRCRN